jgi:transcriptional regulator with XRE-family HTH domain
VCTLVQRGSDATDAGDTAYDATRRRIPDQVRTARKAKGWSQQQLGEAIGVSRFTVNRLEAGSRELSIPTAEKIEAALGSEGLVALVAKRNHQAESGERRSDRDILVRRILRTPELQMVRIILADDLDIHELMADSSALAATRVQIFVPTARRERELFHGQPIYGHIEHQIKVLTELADRWRSQGSGSLNVYESPAVMAPTVLVRSPDGTECAYWPVVPSGPLIDGSELPAVSSLDPGVTAQIEAHIEAVQAQASQIQRNEALAIVHPQARPTGENRPIIFTRFEAGGEQEDRGEHEAITVALVLIHSVCPRPGLMMGRRILVYRRDDYGGRWSLPGHAVEEVDVRRARLVAESGQFADPRRSSSDALSATLEHGPYFRRFEGEIPLGVFQEAASRGLWRDFGIEVHVDRVKNVVLPQDLQRISKEHDDRDHSIHRIVPRLFTLDLEKVPGAGSTHELSEIKKRADVEEWGYQDLAEHQDLNDFLMQARKSGFLLDLCRDLEVVPR